MAEPQKGDGSAVMVHCGECGHSWIAAYLPLEVSKFALILSRAICPKCAATKIFMGLGNGHY